MDALLLPSLRERARISLWFLAVAQSLYAVALLFDTGPAVAARAAINVARLAALFGCVLALRGEGSRSSTLRITSFGLLSQFAAGLAMSIVRQDVLPMALLSIALTSVTSVFIPWGARVQAALSVAAAVAIGFASLIVYRMGGAHLAFDSVSTVVTAFFVTTWIAWVLERQRKTLSEHLTEARRTDAELSTLRDQLERRVEARTAELEMANRELEGFSYTVSHDLRSPLRTIAGFSQLILDEHGGGLPDNVRGQLSKIHAASRRMDGLIDDMLLLARVGRSALRYEPVDLSKLARAVADELAAESPDRKVEIRIDDLPKVPGDHALLRIALDNLLRNAWKFTSTRDIGHVSVTGETRRGRLLCRVRDDGIGFDPRFQHKLFQPFERLHDDPQFRGSGVGLATVARIVRRHGGEVHASGDLERGATFTIELPIHLPESTSSTDRTTASMTRATSSSRMS